MTLILKPFTRGSWSVDAAENVASITFITHAGFNTTILAPVLDSLVRVTRRVGKNHLDKIAQSTSGQDALSQDQLGQAPTQAQPLTRPNPILPNESTQAARNRHKGT